MNDFKIDATVNVTTTNLDIISMENVLVTLDPGCLWSYLLKDGVRVGIVFEGPARFAVDAITETSAGAIGKSYTGNLEGIQFYIGDATKMEPSSMSATQDHLASLNYSDPSAFVAAVETVQEEHFGGSTRMEISDESDGHVLFGRDENNEKIILVVKDDSLVFTYGERVFVLGEDGFVSIGEDGIAVSRQDGEEVLIGRDGLVDLGHLGPRISRSVGHAMRDMKKLKGLKALKHVHRHTHHGDDLDELDWDD